MSEHWEVGYSFLTDYGKKVIQSRFICAIFPRLMEPYGIWP